MQTYPLIIFSCADIAVRRAWLQELGRACGQRERWQGLWGPGALGQPFPQSGWALPNRLIKPEKHGSPSLYQGELAPSLSPATAPGRGTAPCRGLPIQTKFRGGSVRAGQAKVVMKKSRVWASITAGSNNRGWFIPDLTCTVALAQDTFLSTRGWGCQGTCQGEASLVWKSKPASPAGSCVRPGRQPGGLYQLLPSWKWLTEGV